MFYPVAFYLRKIILCFFASLSAFAFSFVFANTNANANAVYLTPYLEKKKYRAIFVENGYFYIYKNKNTQIKFQECNTFFSINDYLYILTSLPITDTLGLKLTDKDFLFFQSILFQHEKQLQKKITYNKIPSKKIHPK